MNFVVINGETRHVMTLTDADITHAVLAIERYGHDDVVKLAWELYGMPGSQEEYVRSYLMAHEEAYGRPFEINRPSMVFRRHG